MPGEDKPPVPAIARKNKRFSLQTDYLKFLRHIPFLKAVLYYSLTAFGGPHGHIGMMIRTFVQRRKDVTEAELLEYNAFCQMLPGPSSTQTVMLIAMKRGGIPLAILTLILWVLPAATIMGFFSFLIYYINAREVQTSLFLYIQPMSVGFIGFAAARMMQTNVRHAATWGIMIGSLIATLIIKNPWVFPIVLIVAGSISNFSNKRIPDAISKPQPIRWINIWLFGLVFILAGVLSELARMNDWEHRKVFSLFENFYRFGAIVFGGGQALLPMILYQYVSRPSPVSISGMSSEELLTGYGLVQAVPGPVFSFCSFVGGMVMSDQGLTWQIIGCLTATLAVFLPSTLLLFFLFPLYQNLKQHVIIYRALEGINAAVVGIIWASGIVLFQMMPFEWLNAVVAIITFCILFFTRIPAPLIVVGWLLLGWASSHNMAYVFR